MITLRHELVASGFVECECGRTKRIPAAVPKEVIDLYVSGILRPFEMRTGDPTEDDRHVCDPRWLRDEVVRLRATVASLLRRRYWSGH